MATVPQQITAGVVPAGRNECQNDKHFYGSTNRENTCGTK